MTFTDFDHQSGDSMLIADIPYVRMEEEPGHIDSFCYRDYAEALAESVPKGAAPGGELTGLWRLLGDADWAPFIEFTPEGPGSLEAVDQAVRDSAAFFREKGFAL